MKIIPEPPKIVPQSPFEPDLFGNSALASGLKNLVSQIDQPLVIALDGEWGSGKSTFLKQWKAQLEGSDPPYAVIYFDAFENDYIDDAFAVLVREVLILLEQNSLQDEIKNFKERAVACGMILLRAGAKLATKAAIRAVTAGLATDSDISDIRTDLESEAANAATALITNLLESPTQQKTIIENFRLALEQLPRILSPAEKGASPLIFIIDELDRCRPAFALSLLEHIKHFMSVPNIHFVLGVHMEQLCNSVRAQYGHEIDARTYLQKFVSLSVSMRSSAEDYEQGRQAKYVQYLISSLGVHEKAAKKIQQCKGSLVRITTHNNLSLRTIERVYSRLVLAATFGADSRKAIPYVLSGLCCLKVVKPDLFEKAKERRLAFSEVERFFALEMARLRSSPLKREREAWAYFLDGETPQNESEYSDLFWNDDFPSPQHVVQVIARDLVDLFGA
jgi:hypothetical protein